MDTTTERRLRYELDADHVYFTRKVFRVFGKEENFRHGDKLLQLVPSETILLNLNEDGTSYSEKVISATLIHKGDILKVLPGARIAADGVLLDSEMAYVDESMLSGESMPVKKYGNDAITGGTLNAGAVFLMRADRIGSETSLFQIVTLVENAQLAKAPIQAAADSISNVFVPFVVIVSLSHS